MTEVTPIIAQPYCRGIRPFEFQPEVIKADPPRQIRGFNGATETSSLVCSCRWNGQCPGEMATVQAARKLLLGQR